MTDKSRRKYYETVVGGGEMGAGRKGEMDNIREVSRGREGVRHNGREARI
jgi:hypothetical protein